MSSSEPAGTRCLPVREEPVLVELPTAFPGPPPELSVVLPRTGEIEERGRKVLGRNDAEVRAQAVEKPDRGFRRAGADHLEDFGQRPERGGQLLRAGSRTPRCPRRARSPGGAAGSRPGRSRRPDRTREGRRPAPRRGRARPDRGRGPRWRAPSRSRAGCARRSWARSLGSPRPVRRGRPARGRRGIPAAGLRSAP